MIRSYIRYIIVINGLLVARAAVDSELIITKEFAKADLNSNKRLNVGEFKEYVKAKGRFNEGKLEESFD